MSKLERKTLKVFAENAPLADVNQFGGIKTQSKDIETIQELDAWQQGWRQNLIGNNKYPTLQARNGLDYVMTYQTAYLLQEGVPEWNVDTTYNVGSICKPINDTTGKLYISRTNDNKGNALTSSSYWKVINPDIDIMATFYTNIKWNNSLENGYLAIPINGTTAYCFQWGRTPSTKGYKYPLMTVAFIIPYITAESYIVTGSATYSQTAGDKGSTWRAYDFQANGFTIGQAFEQRAGSISWQAAGFVSMDYFKQGVS